MSDPLTTMNENNPDQNSAPAQSRIEPESSSKDTAGSKLNPMQVVGSVFAAGLGVQSSRNRERDFKQGRAGVFIAAGVVFTALFVATVYTIVTIVLSGR